MSRLTGSRIVFPPAEYPRTRDVSQREQPNTTANNNNNKFETPKLAQKSKQK